MENGSVRSSRTTFTTIMIFGCAAHFAFMCDNIGDDPIFELTLAG